MYMYVNVYTCAHQYGLSLHCLLFSGYGLDNYRTMKIEVSHFCNVVYCLASSHLEMGGTHAYCALYGTV